MRRLSLLLVSAVMALTLIAVAAGVAWAVTKDCPPEPQECTGTSGNDVLNSSPEDNIMVGLAGNDTYTNFVKPNPGFDVIDDAAGTDKLVLTNYTAAESPGYCLDVDENGNADSLYIDIPPKDPQSGFNNAVVVLDFFSNQSQKCEGQGPGYIEAIQFAGGGGAGLTGLKPR